MATVTDTPTTTTTQPPPPPPELTTDELAVKVVNKRYQGLIMVRTKAIKGKGAWYWAHLEPILVPNQDSGEPKAVKLRCCLCEAVFSASNPSRTASEHLKRGTCPNFNPGSSPDPTRSDPVQTQTHRKRRSGGGGFKFDSNSSETTYSVAPITMIEPPRFSVDVSYPTRPDPVLAFSGPTRVPGLYSQQQHQHQQQQQQSHVVLSGGKQDLDALAMLEDSVKKLKSPRSSSPGRALTKAQIDSSLESLANWVYENCGSVSFSSLEHPKFKSFLNQVGLPALTRRDIAGERLELKYKEAKAESEAQIRDALFFQISSDGWKPKVNGNNNRYSGCSGDVENLVNLCVNLPNGTSVFRRGVFTSGYVFSKYAEDVLWETICDICGNNLEQCVGIVSDKFKGKALRNLENQHHWMVNLCCQFQGVSKLIQDFNKELPLFHNVAQNCMKVANFVNTKSQIRHSFLKYQLQEYGRAALLRVPFGRVESEPVFQMVEDVLSSTRALQLVFLDESCKMVLLEDQTGKEIEEIIRSRFWNELEAVHSLVRLIKGMAQEIEKEKPRIGQCLPLWEELRVKIKEWCGKYHVNESHVDKVFDRRFKRNYHPAWAAAFILDPFYLIRDISGKYLPPFKCLTSEQEKDVDKLITRLVSRDEAHIALMELMKWRTEGLESVYAQAVQLKQRDPVTGKMKIANPQSSRLVWETYLPEFKCLRKVAVRLIFLHATSCGFKWNSSLCRWAQSRNGIDKAQKLIFIAAHSKIERRDFSIDEEKDVEFFSLASREDDVLNEVMFDASSL
ncbi:uncharacterized protein LOC143578220 [Bidens hawaiensis]|uniref:uncharacterized protein LOC143578220 n=1 Tax=Bidens hawaiensis TaxID=980011 RepID=UPI00404AD57E